MTLVSVLLLVRNGSHQLELSPRNILHLRSQSPRQWQHLSKRCPMGPVSSSPPTSAPPLRALPVPFPIEQGTSCHRGRRLTHLYSHGLDAVQDLLLVPSQSHPYSQEVSGRQIEKYQWAVEGCCIWFAVSRCGEGRKLSWSMPFSSRTATVPKCSPVSITGTKWDQE